MASILTICIFRFTNLLHKKLASEIVRNRPQLSLVLFIRDTILLRRTLFAKHQLEFISITLQVPMNLLNRNFLFSCRHMISGIADTWEEKNKMFYVNNYS
jgi:hypothetical protein